MPVNERINATSGTRIKPGGVRLITTGSLRYELYHRENQQWLTQLQFFKTEMIYFEKWLTQLATLNLPIYVQNKRLGLLEQLIQQKFVCIELTNANII